MFTWTTTLSRMSKLLLLYATILVGIIFLIIPDWYTPIDLFLFSDMKLSGANFIYLVSERSVLVILAYVLWTQEREYVDALSVFFWLMVADLFDFILGYNSVWFSIDSFPISMNVLKAIIFGFVILRELWRKYFR